MIIEWIILGIMVLVTLEFGLHVVYHAVTGKGNLYDPPFDYIFDLFKIKRK